MHPDRVGRVQAALSGGEALVLSPGATVRYLTGFDEPQMERPVLLTVTPDDVRFLVPALYEEQVRDTGVGAVETWPVGGDPWEVIDNALGGRDRLLVDDAMRASFVLALQDAVPDASCGLASTVMDAVRAVKDDTELDAIGHACSVADRVVAAVRDWTLAGETEDAVAARIRDAFDEYGGDDVAFDPIVGSGPNGAKPHHRHGDRVIADGDPIVVDLGCVVDGYRSDMTRMVVAGDAAPPDAFREVYDVIRRAQRAAIDAVAPGGAAHAVDAAAREVIVDAGYGDAFVHRTGHGIGLETHEAPYIGPDDDTVLEAGMVFSVEPGIYLSDRFGVRVEDLVAVTADGCERLTRAERGL